MSSQPSQAPLLSVPGLPRLHPKSCPTCGQKIPPEKLEEIAGRIAAREREQILNITAQIEKQYAAERTRVDAQAKAELDAMRAESAAREARVRDEVSRAAEQQLKVKLAEADQARAAEAAGWQQELATAHAARQSAEQASAAWASQIESLRAETAQRERDVREEERKIAADAAAVRIAEAENAREQSEAGRIAAEQKGDSLAAELQELRQTNQVEVAKVKQESAAEVDRAREMAAKEAEARLRDSLVQGESAIAEANARAQQAEAKLATQTEEFNASIEERLNAQREILDKAKDEAVNAEKARAFEDYQGLSNKLADLQRAFDKKTAEELGEGAEVDLYETLRNEFPDDAIRRIPKGTPGADIEQIVKLNGKPCGTIIYDSKNHKQFRWEHVTKLREDQLAARAEHAILSTRKFPEGTRQLHLHDGVLLANPARVVPIATMIRQHLIQLYQQRVSSIERDSKTAALYAFIVSERCSSLLARIDERAEDLLEQQQKEMNWHKKNWEKQGEAIRGIQKAKADMESEITLIIGTSSDDAAA
jgi:hypothetical protein